MSYQSYPNLPPQIPKRWFTYILLAFCGIGALANFLSLQVFGIVLGAIQGYIFYLIYARRVGGHKIYFVVTGLSVLAYLFVAAYTEVGILGILMYIIYLDYNFVNKQSVNPQFGYQGAAQYNAYSNPQNPSTNAPQYPTGNPAYYPTGNVQTNTPPTQFDQGVSPQNTTLNEGQKAGIPLNFCGNCGKKILEVDASFCQNCGTPIKK